MISKYTTAQKPKYIESAFMEHACAIIKKNCGPM